MYSDRLDVGEASVSESVSVSGEGSGGTVFFSILIFYFSADSTGTKLRIMIG